MADDSRVTRVGRLLRRTKLDELPQLVNVLRGEMSIVGPRPEDPRYVALYTPEQRAQILSIRPGLTSPASVRFRDGSSPERRGLGPRTCAADYACQARAGPGVRAERILLRMWG